jgi:hypothetical protein
MWGITPYGDPLHGVIVATVTTAVRSKIALFMPVSQQPGHVQHKVKATQPQHQVKTEY